MIIRPKPIRSIPPNAKQVFSGVIFTIYQWEQQMFDGSVKTFEMAKRPDTVMIVPVTKDKKIILTRQEQPGLSFTGLAGGRIDPGEDILTAAKRELLEETGYTSEDWELLNSIQPAGEKIDWFVFNLLARNVEPVADQRLDSGEKIQLLILDFDEFLSEIMKDGFRDPELQSIVCKMKDDPQKMASFKLKILA